mmetsp:Transcript_144773/g.367414  ORF Transcript_144773/g.367414 Transcript_144773/m.367414 type:complete len:401 (+) Transcript_144773:492-1694(+)
MTMSLSSLVAFSSLAGGTSDSPFTSGSAFELDFASACALDSSSILASGSVLASDFFSSASRASATSMALDRYSSMACTAWARLLSSESRIVSCCVSSSSLISMFSIFSRRCARSALAFSASAHCSKSASRSLPNSASFSSAALKLATSSTSLFFAACSSSSTWPLSSSATVSFSCNVRCLPSSDAKLACTSARFVSSELRRSSSEALSSSTRPMLARNSFRWASIAVTCCDNIPFSPCNASNSSCNLLLSPSTKATLSSSWLFSLSTVATLVSSSVFSPVTLESAAWSSVFSPWTAFTCAFSSEPWACAFSKLAVSLANSPCTDSSSLADFLNCTVKSFFWPASRKFIASVVASFFSASPNARSASSAARAARPALPREVSSSEVRSATCFCRWICSSSI